MYKNLMTVLALILGLFFVGLFSYAARGADNLTGIAPGDQRYDVVEAPTQDDADLQVGKIPSQNPVLAGTSLDYTISITNSGVVPAIGVVLTDTLPAEVTFVSSIPADTECAYNENDHRLECNLGDLAVGANTQVLLTVQVPASASGSLTNEAAVDSTTLEADPTDNTTTQVTTVDAEADLALLKIDDPDPVVADNLLAYTITISNNGPSDAVGVTLSDILPAGVAFVSVVPSPVCGVANQTLTCNFASLAAGSDAVVTLTVRPNNGLVGPLNNTASVSASTTDPISLNNSEPESTGVIHNADISLLKTGDPTALPPGETLTYTLQVLNNGPKIAPEVILNDSLPVQVVFQSVTTDTGVCDYTTTVDCELGSLDSGASASIDVVVTVDSAALSGSMNNDAQISATDLADPNPGNNTDSFPVTISDRLVDVSVSILGTPDPVLAGGTLTYIVDVANNGPSDAGGVVVTDVLPPEVTLVSATSDLGSCSGESTVVCDLGTVPAGASPQITIEVDVDPTIEGPISNDVEVTGDDSDTSLANNADSVDTLVNAEADLEITKSAIPSPVIAGTTLTYTLVITNNGPSNARDLIVTDILPADVGFLSSTPGPTDCNQSEGVVSCSFQHLPPSASETITILTEVNPNKIGTMSNQASVTTATLDPVPANDTDTVVVTVTPEIEPPTVSWVLPVTDGGVYYVTSEIILLRATASDNVGVDFLRFYRWDASTSPPQYVEIGNDYTIPYQLTLNSELLNPEWNEIFVEAYDINGNKSERKHIWIVRRWELYFPLIRK